MADNYGHWTCEDCGEKHYEWLDTLECARTTIAKLKSAIRFYAEGNWRIGESYRDGEYQGVTFDREGPIGDSGKLARDVLRRT